MSKNGKLISCSVCSSINTLKKPFGVVCRSCGFVDIDEKNYKGGTELNMGTIKEKAQDFVPQQTKNISELDAVSVDLEIFDTEGTDDEGKSFKYSYIEVNGEKYRIPNSVISQLKDLTEANPNLKNFKVKKTGEGLKTRYTTIPLP